MADRDLIVGVLATQAGFATPAQIMEAAAVWLVDKNGPSFLATLETSGAITAEQRAVLEDMASAAFASSDGERNQDTATIVGGTVSLIPVGGVPANAIPSVFDLDSEERIP